MIETELDAPKGKKMLVPGPTIINFSKTPTAVGPIPKYGERNQQMYGNLLGVITSTHANGRSWHAGGIPPGRLVSSLSSYLLCLRGASTIFGYCLQNTGEHCSLVEVDGFADREN